MGGNLIKVSVRCFRLYWRGRQVMSSGMVEREREREISLMYFKGFLLYSGHDYRLLHVCCDVCSRKCRENEMKSFFFSSVFSFCVQNFVCVHRFLSLPLPRLGPHDITDREWEEKRGGAFEIYIQTSDRHSQGSKGATTTPTSTTAK